MPRCPKCRHKNPENYNFCSQCGAKNEETRTSCTYHFVVMGSGGVGKSAITIRFVNRQFEAKVTLTMDNGQFTLLIFCFSNSDSPKKIDKNG
jgi:GTPase SAR1 family protein